MTSLQKFHDDVNEHTSIKITSNNQFTFDGDVTQFAEEINEITKNSFFEIINDDDDCFLLCNDDDMCVKFNFNTKSIDINYTQY